VLPITGVIGYAALSLPNGFFGTLAVLSLVLISATGSFG
jgi:hypothetical protein